MNRISIEQIRHWLAAKACLLPWLSLSWGLLSGLLVARDFAHGSRLLFFSIALMVFSLLLSVWFSWKEQVTRAGFELKGLAAQVHARATWVEWAGVTATQMALQYVFMFSVTFLIFSKAWFLLTLTLGFGVTVMWDPWFQRLMQRGWYEGAVRSLGTMLATSFAMSLFFPKGMKFYSLCLAGMTIFAAFPWRRLWWLRARALGYRRIFLAWDTAPLAFVLLIALWNGSMARLVPPLSVWVRNAALGEGVEERELVESFARKVSLGRFGEAQAGLGVCCWTPLVAPRALRVGLVHEWRINGRTVDRIAVGEASGLDEAAAYRTYSCKRSFPGVAEGVDVECVVYLSSGQRVGRVALEIDR